MDGVTFSENEQRHFAELFSAIDTENSGKISGARALDLLRRSCLSAEDIQKVFELCGAARLGHFGRSQFYLALKLVAAAQNGFILNQDTFKSQASLSIALPKFSNNVAECPVMRPTKSSPIIMPSLATHSSPLSNNTPQLIPPPSSKASPRTRNGSGFNKGSPSLMKSLTPSSSPEPGSSPRALADQGWQSFVDEKDEKWTNSEEGCRLIEGEDDEEESDASDEDDASVIDVFAVSDEQKEYYVKQFLSIESNPQGKITGNVAKDFFEKSKLEAIDLSRIWQLSDVDKDGALNLEEFCIAMHLVVLRRNRVELPNVLPSCLRRLVYPKKVKQEAQNIPPLIPLTPSPSNATSVSIIEQTKGSNVKTGMLVNVDNKPLVDCNGLFGETSNWTKFSDSPTPRNAPFFVGSKHTNIPVQKTSMHSSSLQDHSVSSSNSSLSTAPANFDFNASCIESDPKILHPIPLRLTPEGQSLLRSLAEDPKSSQNSLHSLAPPPPPPPRPGRTVSGHARSSSLDLNKMGGRTLDDSLRGHRTLQPHSLSNFNVIPSPTTALTTITAGSSHPSALNVDSSSGTSSHGAFTVYRRRNHTLTDGINSSRSGSSFNAIQGNMGRSLEGTVSLLRNKFSLPKESFIPSDPHDSKEVLRCLKASNERNMRLEKLNDKLIEEMANLIVSSNQRLDSFMSLLSLNDDIGKD